MRKKLLLISTICLVLILLGQGVLVQAKESKKFKTSIALRIVDNNTITENPLGLEGGEFTLYKYQENEEDYKKEAVIYSDINGNVLFTITKAGTYKIKQTKAPKNYIVDEKPYELKFTVKSNKVFNNRLLDLSKQTPNSYMQKLYNLSYDVNQVYVSNKRKKATIVIREDSKSEEESFYTLYKKIGNDGFIGVLKAFITGKTYERVDLSEGQLIINENGEIVIRDLDWGIYYLAYDDNIESAYEFEFNNKNGINIVLNSKEGVLSQDESESLKENK
ncbi:hypothetical protein P261_01298 [Lachnospiraceae bacterium TWA4]|nr:hypothetical protein P261_01298 [Lachnospiraceae bacterium TWA4]